MIYYPNPLHTIKYIEKSPDVTFDNRLKRTVKIADKVLSLPICEGVTNDDISYVMGKIKDFYGV